MRVLRLRSVSCVCVVSVLSVGACSGSGSSKNAGGANSGASTTVPIVTPATQIISDSVPEGATRLHFKKGPFAIVPGQNSIGFTRRIPQPSADGFVVGISTNLELADGTVPPVDVIHLHHGVWLNLAGSDATAPLPERFFAAGEEKTRMILPPGYGYA